MLYAFFWVIPRRLNIICRRFGTICLFHHFPYKYSNILKLSHFYTYPAMKMEQTECSETSAFKIRTPGNYPPNLFPYKYSNILKPSHFS